MTAIAGTQLPLPRIGRGKVRDIYEVDDDRLLLVATDRVSAFDVVMREPIPHKGVVLTQISAWWFGQLSDLVDHHMISADADEIIEAVPVLDGAPRRPRRSRDALPAREGVSDRVRDSRLHHGIGVEGVRGARHARGRGTSGRIARERSVGAADLQSGDQGCHGHDENITVRRMAEIVGEDVARELERLTRAVSRARARDRRTPRHSARRHEVRVWPHARRRNPAHR